MDNLTFDEKIALLALAKSPKEKAELINRWKNDTDFYYGVNAKTLPMSEFMKQDRFKDAGAYAKQLSNEQNNRGWNKSKTSKHIAEIPAFIWNSRPEFSAKLPNKVLAENVRKFLQEYPQFRVSK